MSAVLTYEVAGHRFTVEGPSKPLGNLAPFLKQESEAPLLFSLAVIGKPEEKEETYVFKTNDGPGFPEIEITAVEGGFRFRVKPLPELPLAAVLETDADFKSARLYPTGSDNAFALNNSLMLMFAFSSATHGLLEMHASVVTKDGKGYLFLGKSGTGKSTHSSLWLKHIPGTELLNDDNPILRLMPDGSARVYGSPWSGKTPCYKAKSALAGAVVRLSQAPYNKIVRLPIIDSYASLMSSASSFRPIGNLADGWHRTLEGLVKTLPCYHLECLPDQEAAMLCYSTVTNG